MDRVKKLIKTYWYVGMSGCYDGIYGAFIIMSLVFAIFVLLMEIVEVHDYLKINAAINFQFVFFEDCCQMYLISIAVLSILNIYNYKYRKSITTHKRLFIQFPVCRKDILSARYVIFFACSIIPLIDILFLIFFNFHLGSINYISSYSGFLIAFYCLWFIIICAYIGYSDSLTEKNRYIRILVTIFISSLMLTSVLMPLYNSNKLSAKNMYNAFGSWFSPILKSLRHLGGIGAIFTLIIVEAIGYYLCCKLPIIRFERGLKK